MTKKQLAELVAKRINITDVLAKQTLQTILDSMTEVLARGETLEFRDFGVFKTKVRKPRLGRNPRAGTVVQVPERKVIVWKMGLELKKRLRQ